MLIGLATRYLLRKTYLSKGGNNDVMNVKAIILKSSSAVHILDFHIYSQSFIHYFTGLFGTNNQRCTGIAQVMGFNPVQT